MKKVRDIVEQHREEGRFKPVKPHNVPSVAVVSPRATSDSASTSVKEGAIPSTEKVITVKHKTSGKTLRISANAAAKYRTMGYHHTNEEVEQVDEISQDLAGKYLEKVAHDQTKKVGLKSNLYSKLEPKRQKGVDRALDRMAVKEDTENNCDPLTPAQGTLTKKKADKVQPYVHEEIEQVEEGAFKRIATDAEEDKRLGSWKKETPWMKSKGTVTDKSGAKHTPMSRARDLARSAARKNANIKEQQNVKPNPFTVPSSNPGSSKPVKPQSEYAKARKLGSSTANARARAAGADNPHMFESRGADIIREAMKTARKKKAEKETKGTSDQFQADPELTSQIVKNTA